MPQGTMKTNQTPATAYNIHEWMQGLEEDIFKGEVRNGDAGICGTDQRNAHSQSVGRSRRWCRRQSAMCLVRDISSGPPSLEGGSSNQGSNQSSHQLAVKMGSRESN